MASSTRAQPDSLRFPPCRSPAPPSCSTGATGGIGHAIARALHARGAKLILTGRRSEVLAPLAAELDAQALTVDLFSAP